MDSLNKILKNVIATTLISEGDIKPSSFFHNKRLSSILLDLNIVKLINILPLMFIFHTILNVRLLVNSSTNTKQVEKKRFSLINQED
ncbi:hypothetical protein EGR_05494 [Echinococcus granulosus]|uniref:Uncharacterized protein n=1 Tax=Echinococcus granulosus TaxID=6210 RepID=W6UDY0_ECHGR|nr:hypothetical protein EGR_05494 [Echinococcus granulosus]EUB59595.1 hypothetical protein EGR_05494 [Echinococcus granulosus]